MTTASPLSEDRDEDYSDEADVPCDHCGAIESFEYVFHYDSHTFTGTCTKCGGPNVGATKEVLLDSKFCVFCSFNPQCIPNLCVTPNLEDHMWSLFGFNKVKVK